MAKVEVIMPKMGESVAEATILKWVKNIGDKIALDDILVEIATDKVNSDIPSPVAGILVEILYKEDDIAQVGSPIAIIETQAVATITPVQEVKPEPIPTPTPQVIEVVEQPIIAPAAQYTNNVIPTPTPEILQTIQQPIIAPPVQYTNNVTPTAENNEMPTTNNYVSHSPLVRNIAQKEGISLLELDRIKGTGREGRLTKEDLLIYIENKQKEIIATQNPARQAAVPPTPVFSFTPVAPSDTVIVPVPTPVVTPAIPTPVPAVTPIHRSIPTQEGDEIIEMDRMRKLIAEHMVNSVQTSPHVQSFIEVDVTAIVKWREKIKSKFEQQYQEKITYTPIFIEAVAKSLKDYPMVNVSLDGTKIIKRKHINIGMAAALPTGNLIVPVIKDADTKDLTSLVKAVNDLANRSKTNKLQLDDIQAGTFTVTNVGTFGSVFGTPIINQPQVAILSIGVIKKRPVVLETKEGDVIAIRSMMYLSLSYDHRIVDGALGGMFLKRIAEYLEAFNTQQYID